MASQRPHQVVIVGAGFGGLFATRFLKRAPVEVTLVDRVNYHLFQPLLYQVATGLLSEGQIAPAIRDVLRRQKNVRVELARVNDFDLERRLVTGMRPDDQPLEIPFDSLIVAAGSGQSYFGHDEFSRWAPGMKTIADALEIRGRVFGAFEIAELEEDPAKQAEWLTFVVVGGGPTGVELAGQIAELSRGALRGNFRRIDPSSSRVMLFDGGDEILASFGNRLSSKGARELERLGVEIQTGALVTHVDGTGVEISTHDGTKRQIAARTKIWAAGVHASPLGERLAKAAGMDVDRAGRISVAPDCSLPDHPNVFVVGDMMSLDHLPGVAEVAMQSGIHAARTIHGRLRGRESKPFKYRDLGSMATVARYRAIVSMGRLRLSGFAGWLVWLVVHLTFLTGFKNRFTTAAQWGFNLIGRKRSERTITERAVVARLAIEKAGGDEFISRTISEAQESGSSKG